MFGLKKKENDPNLEKSHSKECAKTLTCPRCGLPSEGLLLICPRCRQEFSLGCSGDCSRCGT